MVWMLVAMKLKVSITKQFNSAASPEQAIFTRSCNYTMSWSACLTRYAEPTLWYSTLTFTIESLHSNYHQIKKSCHVANSFLMYFFVKLVAWAGLLVPFPWQHITEISATGDSILFLVTSHDTLNQNHQHQFFVDIFFVLLSFSRCWALIPQQNGFH